MDVHIHPMVAVHSHGRKGKHKNRSSDKTTTLQLSPEMIMSLVNGVDRGLTLVPGICDNADAGQLKERAKELFSAGDYGKSAFVYAYAAYRAQLPASSSPTSNHSRKFEHTPGTLGSTAITCKERRDFVVICNSNAAQALLLSEEYAGAMHHADEALGLQWVHTKSVWRRVEAYKHLGLYDSARAILRTLNEPKLIAKKTAEIHALERSAPRPAHVLPGCMKCQLVTQQGTIPQARWKGGAVISGNNFILVGGSTYDVQSEGQGFEVSFFDLSQKMWTEHLRYSGTQNPPLGLHSFSTVFHDKAIVLFGGHTMLGDSSTASFTNGVWEYLVDEKQWLQGVSIGKRPRPRQGHSAVLYNHKMWVFGGINQDLVSMNDLWSFDLNSRKWVEVNCRGSHRPSPRFEAFACVHTQGGCMYIYGGGKHIQSEDFWGDLWRFSFATKTWELVCAKLIIPAFQGKCMGRAQGQAFVTDLPVIGPVLFLLAGYQHSCYFATMYAYELQQHRLRVTDWTTDSHPLVSSCGHLMAADPRTNSVFLWGGATSTVLLDQMFQVSYVYASDVTTPSAAGVRDFLSDIDSPLQDLVPGAASFPPETVNASRQALLSMITVHNKIIANAQPHRTPRDQIRDEVRDILRQVETDPILGSIRLLDEKPISIKYSTYILNLRSVLGCIARECGDLREAEEQFNKIYTFLRDNERQLTLDMVEMQRRVLDNLCGLYFESKDENKWVQCMHEYRRCCPDDPMLAMMVDESIIRIAYAQLQDKPRNPPQNRAAAAPSKARKPTTRATTADTTLLVNGNEENSAHDASNNAQSNSTKKKKRVSKK